jgi:hypothetical protein|nr:hypothetical protein [Candidatus Acidoferrales bacterium]
MFSTFSKTLHRTLPLALMLMGSFTIVSPISEAQKSKVSAVADAPVWSVALQDFGYKGEIPGSKRMTELAGFGSVFFIGDDTVVCTFITSETVPGLQRRDDPNLVLPFKLHAVLLDATTGKMRKTLDWGSDGVNVGLFPGANGTFVMFSEGMVAAFSSDGEELSEMRAPLENHANATLKNIRVSPSGATIAVIFGGASDFDCDWIDIKEQAWIRKKCGITEDVAIADGYLAMRRIATNGVPIPSVWVRDLSEDWHVLCQLLAGCDSPEFIDNQNLLLYNRRELRVVSLTGKVPVHLEINTYGDWGIASSRPIRSSMDSHRFGVLITESNSARDRAIGAQKDALPLRIAVYDIPSHQWIFGVENKKGLIRRDSLFALSNSGNGIALLSDGVVRYYSAAPPASTPAHLQ